jgi:hypothetical protein
VIQSSQVNLVTDEDENDGEEDEGLTNEGIVGKKYVALKPYIKEVSTSKEFKEHSARAPENRLFIPRSEPIPL